MLYKDFAVAFNDYFSKLSVNSTFTLRDTLQGWDTLDLSDRRSFTSLFFKGIPLGKVVGVEVEDRKVDKYRVLRKTAEEGGIVKLR